MLGMRFVDALPLFEADPETEAVVLVGEIGGSDEEMATEFVKNMTKPVVAFVPAGRLRRASEWATRARSFQAEAGRQKPSRSVRVEPECLWLRRPRRFPCSLSRRLQGRSINKGQPYLCLGPR